MENLDDLYKDLGQVYYNIMMYEYALQQLENEKQQLASKIQQELNGKHSGDSTDINKTSLPNMGES